MNVSIIRCALALCALSAHACASRIDGQDMQGGSESSGQAVADAEILRFLSESGIEGEISVDRDMGLVIVDDVAIGLAAVEEAIAAQADEHVDKGYHFFGVGPGPLGTWPLATPDGGVSFVWTEEVSAANIGNIKLDFVEPGEHEWAHLPNSPFWKAAFVDAANKWNSAFWNSTAIEIAENNSGPTISVMTTTLLASDKYALAGIPFNGNPGNFIVINPNIVPTCDGGWVPPGCSGGECFARLVGLALHELGHTLGFMHPSHGAAIGTLVPGSNQYNENNPYETVMGQGDAVLCAQTGYLSADDQWSAAVIYPD